MTDLNPYEPNDTSRSAGGESSPQANWMWAMTGFLAGGMIPAGWGTFMLRNEAIYEASLSEIERGRCLNGTFGISILMIIGVCALGSIGAFVGLRLSKISNRL